MSACPSPCITFTYGRRFNYPQVDVNQCLECGKCLKVCPGAFLLDGTDPGFVDEISSEWECYLIHSVDDSVRNDSASGGFITSVILHLLESKQVDGAVVVRCAGENALVAESLIATDRTTVLSARGSKYTPVSNCAVLKEIINIPGRYVFVGTPCMLEGLSQLEKTHPLLKERIALRVGFVCAGMASRLSTRNYIERDGKVDISKVRNIAYRGGGWPGRFRVFGEDETILMDRPLIGGSLTHVVGVDHYLRCENCLDHWAHFADVTVSDPWFDEMIRNEKQGSTAIMIRTERGKEVVDALIRSGNVVYRRIAVNDMLSYNKHLLIDGNHPRHVWMALYQLIFNHSLRYLPFLVGAALRQRIEGLITTLKALFSSRYYY